MTDILPNVRWQKWKCLHFWLWHYRWNIQSKADWRTTGRKWNSFTLHSMDKQWHVLGTITYHAFYISRTIIGMELTEQTVENIRPTWNYKDELSKILHAFQIFGSRWSHCEIQGRIVFKQYIPKKNANVSASKCSNCVTLQVIRGLLEKYPTFFFYANTWWIII